MSNRRTAQRRDAHGAPVRTRQELAIAVLTVIGVLAVTVVLLIALRIRPPSAIKPVAPAPTSTAPPGSPTSPPTPGSTPGSTPGTDPASSTTQP